MKAGSNILVTAAARLYGPLVALLGLAILSDRSAGSGVGFVAGLAFGSVFLVHALVLGASAARSALPPVLSRLLLALGVAVWAGGAGLPQLPFAAQAVEAGVFVVTCATTALVVQTAFGRAATLRGDA